MTVSRNPTKGTVVFSVAEARDLFMSRLHALEPACFASLCTPAGITLARNALEATLSQWAGDCTTSRAEAWEAGQAKHNYIKDWRRRWNLLNDTPPRLIDSHAREWLDASRDPRRARSANTWMGIIAGATLHEYMIAEKHGESVPTAFRPMAGVLTGKPALLVEDTVNGHPVSVDIYAHPLALTLTSDSGLWGLTWNPRVEQRAEARERLIAMIDVALDRIESDVPSWTILDAHLDLLVRFQVLKQSHNAIARDLGRDRSHVTRDINSCAAFIGLQLRDGRADAGRPRSRRGTGHTIRVNK